jgi:hypothetical protein
MASSDPARSRMRDKERFHWSLLLIRPAYARNAPRMERVPSSPRSGASCFLDPSQLGHHAEELRHADGLPEHPVDDRAVIR